MKTLMVPFKSLWIGKKAYRFVFSVYRLVNDWKPIRTPFWIPTSEFCFPESL